MYGQSKFTIDPSITVSIFSLLLLMLFVRKYKTLEIDDDTYRWRTRQTWENTARRITLDRSFHVTHFERTVVYRLGEQKQSDQKQTDVGNVHSTVILCVGHSAVGNTHTDS